MHGDHWGFNNCATLWTEALISGDHRIHLLPAAITHWLTTERNWDQLVVMFTFWFVLFRITSRWMNGSWDTTTTASEYGYQTMVISGRYVGIYIFYLSSSSSLTLFAWGSSWDGLLWIRFRDQLPGELGALVPIYCSLDGVLTIRVFHTHTNQDKYLRGWLGK